MKESRREESETLISLQDITNLIKRSQSRILTGSLLFACLAGGYALTKPIEYEAEATFLEKERPSTDMNPSSFAVMLLSSSSNGGNSEAVSTMQSRKLLEKLIRAEGLQAELKPKNAKPSTLKKIFNNLKIEYSRMRKREFPSVSDPNKTLGITNVDYEGEVPVEYHLTFLDEENYELYDQSRNLLGNGKIGHPFSTQDAFFKIIRTERDPIGGTQYTLTLSPLFKTAKNLMQSLEIEPHKEDKNLIVLKTVDRDRHLAARKLNQLMLIYQQYLKEEQSRISKAQLAYLSQREDEMSSKLQKMMDDYAETVSSDIAKLGFASSTNALEFLANLQQSYKEKLLTIDLGIKRQEYAKKIGVDTISKQNGNHDSRNIDKFVEKLHQLKQQSDSIQLALNKSSDQKKAQFQPRFEELTHELERIQLCCNEAEAVRKALIDHHTVPQAENLLNHPKYMAKSWLARLHDGQKRWKNAPHSEKALLKADWMSQRNLFLTYLDNLIHSLKLQQKTLQEHLIHQQEIESEFQGLSLVTAKELYVEYAKKLNEIESEAIQQQSILDQMQKPDFEITSLTTVLKDSVSQKMIQNVHSLTLQLKDEENRSHRERERHQKELETQSVFLTSHLKQLYALSTLQQSLIQSKITSLQRTMLGLIQQQTSIIEKYLADTIDTSIVSLNEERNLIEQQQSEINNELSKIPQEWVKEQLIHHQLKMNEKMVEEITKLVESKNISHNLIVIQSSPIDFAIPEIHPKSPKFLILTVLGALLGASFSIGVVVVGAIMNGIKVSKENIELTGAHFSGELSSEIETVNLKSLTKTDLSTLRRLVSFLKGKDKLALILHGNGPDFSKRLAELFSLQGQKVLLVPVCFDRAAEAKGLFQYLEGTEGKPVIQREQQFDWIQPGGVSQFSSELLQSEKFQNLLAEYTSEYDHVLAVSHALPCSAEAESQLLHFNVAAICLKNETLDEISSLTHIDRKEITFLLDQKVL